MRRWEGGLPIGCKTALRTAVRASHAKSEVYARGNTGYIVGAVFAPAAWSAAGRQRCWHPTLSDGLITKNPARRFRGVLPACAQRAPGAPNLGTMYADGVPENDVNTYAWGNNLPAPRGMMTAHKLKETVAGG